MIFINSVYKEEVFPRAYAEGFIKLLNPVAPHISEEIWEILGHHGTMAYESWPVYDDSKIVEDTKEIAVQVMVKFVLRLLFLLMKMKKALKRRH